MVVLAVCDSNYRFAFVDIGSYGRASDSAIYQNSLLFKKLKVTALHIPSDKQIRMGGESLPFTFVGDEAFALSTHVQWPHGGKNLSRENKSYNYRLSRARRYMECSFGILTNKHVVHYTTLSGKETVDVDCTLSITVLEEGDALIQPANMRSALTIRENFEQYFSSEEGSSPRSGQAQTDGSIRYHTPPKVARSRARFYATVRSPLAAGTSRSRPCASIFASAMLAYGILPARDRVAPLWSLKRQQEAVGNDTPRGAATLPSHLRATVCPLGRDSKP
ncbi:hypothetical protein PR048_026442 [Dryococelus australis]|uniref:DDE Tnp4 domain-containing protein n=1 Tax=Dryococelus australis TaxID=614101 RepID=A0ABQ9GLB8_9NEOP|nr:hypothetical protein PR048_026442 [Dryococelus australis]